jgi:hypothetical protein
MSVVKYVWDMQNVLAETDGANAQQALYTQAPQVYGRLVSQRQERVQLPFSATSYIKAPTHRTEV